MQCGGTTENEIFHPVCVKRQNPEARSTSCGGQEKRFMRFGGRVVRPVARPSEARESRVYLEKPGAFGGWRDQALGRFRGGAGREKGSRSDPRADLGQTGAALRDLQDVQLWG